MSLLGKLFDKKPHPPDPTSPASAREFLGPLSRKERVAVSNRNPDVYEAVISAKRAGNANPAFVNLDTTSRLDVGQLLWKLDIPDLERLTDAVRFTLQADAAAASDLNEAARLYKNAFDRNPYDDLAAMSYGVALSQAGELQEGMKWVKRALELNPANERAKRNLAAIKSHL